jgi:exopolysaccharide production protein ExoQ
MNALVANLVYSFGVAALFYLNRDNSTRTSKALWLPVLYLWILGSRPVSYWLGSSTGSHSDNIQLDSPFDEAFFAILLIATLGILFYRKSQVLRFLSRNGPILVYFLYCFLSVLWSDFPGVAFKRSIKAILDPAMVLIVLTDKQPVAALSRLFSRTAFILVPFSLLFCKYYPDLGREYDPWTGRQLFTGLTTDKNMLGVITYVLLLGALWRVLALVRSKEIRPYRGRILWAQGTLLALGTYLLIIADSVTSKVSFAVGTILMLATSSRFIRRNTAAIHALVLLLVVAVSSPLLLGVAGAVKALGRDATFSGRTDIWAGVIRMAPNPLVGAGFESFWSRSARQKLAESVGGQDLNEAHNGYIEVYIQLGWVGVSIMAFILIDGYRRSVATFRRNPVWGGLLIAYVVSAMVYSLTEAGFRMLDPIWIFLLLAIFGSGASVPGIIAQSPKCHHVVANRVRGLTTTAA